MLRKLLVPFVEPLVSNRTHDPIRPVDIHRILTTATRKPLRPLWVTSCYLCGVELLACWPRPLGGRVYLQDPGAPDSGGVAGL
jgi:hypothetical protein